MLLCVTVKDMIVPGIMKYFRNVLGYFSSLYQAHCLLAFSNKSRRLTNLKSSFTGQRESSKIMSSSCIQNHQRFLVPFILDPSNADTKWGAGFFPFLMG